MVQFILGMVAGLIVGGILETIFDWHSMGIRPKSGVGKPASKDDSPD
jgi:hypothetical protein